MIETLLAHRGMIGNPRYGLIGMYALPFYVVAELLGPLVEGVGFVVLPIAYAAGIVDLTFVLQFVLVTSGFGTVLSWYSILGESVTDGGYVSAADRSRLLLDGLVENVGYRQWKTVLAWRAVTEYLRGSKEWGVMDRAGLE